MYFHSVLDPSSNAYFQQLRFNLSGLLDPTILALCFQDLVDRHDVLRTLVTSKNASQPLIVFLKQKKSLWQFTDLSDQQAQSQNHEIQRLMSEDLKQGIDFNKGNLFRSHLIRTSANTYELILSFHHLIMDGQSFPILHHDLFEFYRSRNDHRSPQLKTVPSYARYLAWWKDRDFKSDQKFWKTYLSGYKGNCEIPSTVGKSAPGAQLELHSIRFGSSLTQKIEGITREIGVTQNQVMLSIWGVLLSQLTNRNDVVFGVTVNGRPMELPGADYMLGLFINTVPFRVEIGESSFTELLQQSRDGFADINEHQYLPLADIQNYTEAGKDLLQHILVFEGGQDGHDEDHKFLPGVEVEAYSIYEQTHYALELSIFPEDRIRLRFGYDPQRLSKWDIENLGLRLEHIANSLLNDPDIPLSQHSILPRGERKLILDTFSRGGSQQPRHHSLVEAFDAICAVQAERIAVSDEEGSCTYQTVYEQTIDVARYLQGNGVSQGDRVVLLISRSRYLPAILLGVLRSGAAYIPLSVTTPTARIQTILEDTEPAVILTDMDSLGLETSFPIVQLTDALSDPKKDQPTFPTINPNDSAYVIYTSGSTGKPKGVEVTHGNLLSFFENMSNGFGLRNTDRLLALTTYTFDISGLELLGTMINGIEVVISDDSSFLDPNSILRLITDKKCSAIQITPSHLAVLLESDGREILKTLRVILVGGEALPKKLAAQLCQYSKTRVINVYGPTETTIWSTASEVSSEDVTIGQPLLNESAQVVTGSGHIAPVGVQGDLLIGGAGVARGYWRDEQKTGDVFRDFHGEIKGRHYRTGDIARWLPSGSLEFFGRNDNQIKIRGFRVELGEIEQKLSTIHSIEHAVVVYDSEQKLLHAFLGTDGQDFQGRELSEQARLMLPAYMLPASYNRVESFPLTASGKVDRQALLNSLTLVEPEQTEMRPPQDDEEKLLAGIFETLFPGRTISRDSDFFRLGGHSLKAMALVARIQKIAKIELPLLEVFNKPRLMDLAVSLRLAVETTARPIPTLDKQDQYEVSNAQKRFWILDQLEPEHGHLYLMGGVSMLKGSLDRDAFNKTFLELMARHEVLRTSITVMDGIPCQTISNLDSIPVYEYDFSSSSDNPDSRSHSAGGKSSYHKALEFVYEEMAQGFDLTKPPLWKLVLIRLGPDRHLLLLKIHHIICDASSINILEHEFAQLYEKYSQGKDEPLLENIEIQQKDYSAWLNARIEKGVFKESENYWKRIFSQRIPSLELPSDHPRPARPGYAGDTVSVTLQEDLKQKLMGLSNDLSITPYALYAAITSILLGRLAQQEKMVLLCPVSGRAHVAIENTVGLFLNTVPLVLSLELNMRFQDHLLHTQDVVKNALSHSQYPFDRLVDVIAKDRTVDRPPISGIILTLHEETESNATLGALEVESVPLKMNISRMDLSFELSITPHGADLSATYSKDLFNKDRVEAMLQQWVTIAETALVQPETRISALPLFTDDVKKQILCWSRGPVQEHVGPSTIDQVFDHIAVQSDAIAISDGSSSISYSELRIITDQYAEGLSTHKEFVRQKPIAVLMDRSQNTIIAMLSIMKAGGVFLPLEKKAPIQRNQLILEESGVKLIIVDDEYGNEYGEKYSIQKYDSMASLRGGGSERERVQADDSAYLIFTSGSTGVPKGVLVPHQSFVNMINHQISRMEIGPGDVILQFASFAFDAALAETFQALCSGATLEIAAEDIIADPVELLQFIQSKAISVATLPPAYLHTLEKAPLGNLRLLMTAGDVPIIDDVEYYRSKYRYFNAYGPTEFSVCGSMQEVDNLIPPGGDIPMGQAMANCAIYVLDQNRQLLSPGVIGEIYLAGAGVSQGYINREIDNGNWFLDDPFQNGWKMYRTGDLGVRDGHGKLYFKGRSDFQVKIRGYRIDLGEIETALKGVETVRDAIVLAKEYKDLRKGLLAVLVGDSSSGYEHIRDSLSQILPEYMMPSSFVFVDRFPLNVNGKIDRKALLNLQPSSDIPLASSEMLNELEKQCAHIWQVVLEKKILTSTEHFFKRGGDSLSAIQMTTLLSKALKRSISVKTIFQYPTLSDFALHMEQQAPSIAKTGKRTANTSTTVPQKHVVDIYNQPLETLVSEGALARVDSVALSYYSNAMIEGSDLSEESFLQLSDPDVHLRYHITTAHGVIGVIHLPRFSSSIYSDKQALLSEIREALELSRTLGASHVSLTGLIPSATTYGHDIVELIKESDSDLPFITTGHDVTASSVLLAVEKMLATTGRGIEDLRVAFLGMGSVGKSVLELMLDQMPDLHEIMLADLFANKRTIDLFVEDLVEKYPHFENAEIILSEGGVSKKIYEADLIIGATNVPDLIDVQRLKKGCMIVDDSGPHCFSIEEAVERLSNSGDILFTEGGVLRSNSPFGVSAFLTDKMKKYLTQRGLTPFEDFQMDRITGCVLSGLIDHYEKRGRNLTGPVIVEDSRSQYLKLKSWEYQSAPLHAGSYEISEKQIEAYISMLPNMMDSAS